MLHKLIQHNLNSDSALVQILLMVSIFEDDYGISELSESKI